MRTLFLTLSPALAALLWLSPTPCHAEGSTSKPSKPASPTAAKPKSNKTKTGLVWEVLKEGMGPQPKVGDTVRVHYVGTLLNGKKFDSSRDRGAPFTFPLGRGQVIPGWDEGVALMRPGALYRFTIPPELAYGPRGAGEAIPPDSTLVFEVEFLGVVK
jgi:FKBP-type peptidyl-prolyl cis-trans isomerase